MSAHVLLSLLNELRKIDKRRGWREHFITFSKRFLINSIIEEHEC